MSTCQKQYKQIFDGHEKECYTLDINAKTGGKAIDFKWINVPADVPANMLI